MDNAPLLEKPLPFEGYVVASDGRVWSKRRWHGTDSRPLKTHPNRYGYLAAKIMVGKKLKNIIVHRHVCAAFHGPKPSPAHQVRHLNGDKYDNRPENLAWGTATENAADRAAHGRETAREIGLRNKGRKHVKKSHCRKGHIKERLGRWCLECRRIAYHKNPPLRGAAMRDLKVIKP